MAQAPWIRPPPEEDVPLFFDMYYVGGKFGSTSGGSFPPIDMRECHASHGSVCITCACVGNWSSWSWHYCVACMASPLDITTTIEGDPILYALCGALGRKRRPVAPVSATPVRMFVVGDWCYAWLTFCPGFRLPTCTTPMIQSLGLFRIYRLVCWFVRIIVMTL